MTIKAKEAQRTAMKNADLGGLANAVRSRSGRSKDRAGNPNAWGSIYAAGGDESRAGQALEAYSQGTVIKPVKGDWLWYQTDKIKRVSKVPGDTKRRRLTPARYRQMGNPLGPLKFALLRPNFAMLYVEEVDVSVRTGLASPRGKRKTKTKVRMARVVLFWGIRHTKRAKRYDPNRIVEAVAEEVPVAIAAEMRALLRR